jgi:imidazolonepropionase-like amidohydrolase
MDLFVDEARVWDGTGAPAQAGMDVWIHDGVIAALADELTPPEGAQVLDGRGLTAVPGLIDAHVHLSLDPGGALRNDTPAVRDTLLRQHLAAYLACGVTTIVDPAVTLPEWDRIRAALDGGAPGPEYLAMGPPLSPPDGYLPLVLGEFPSVADADAVRTALAALTARGAPGTKVTLERGLLEQRWPLHTEEMLATIRTEAAAQGLPVYVHARTAETWTLAVEALGAHALVHGLDRPDREAIALAAEHHVYVMPTLSILEVNRTAWQPERLADPLVVRTVPAIELATASDPAAVRTFARRMVEVAAPHAPAKGLLARVAMSELVLRPRLRREYAAVRALRDAGVPLVLGSDSGNWPIFPFEFHGPTSIGELELLVEAGLTPEEALTAGTRTAAELLGRDDLGRLRPGARADLLLVRGDPLADPSALRTLAWVVARGEARAPEDWVGPR